VVAPPPPDYIPPPEIQVTQPPPPQEHVITQTQHTVAAPFEQHAPPAAKVADSGPSSQPAVGSSRPEFPDQYQDSGRSGTVTVSCTIQADGHPSGCSLVNVTGGAAFGSSVMAWLRSGSALYKPAIRNGVAIASQTQLTVHFNAAD
jgi:protein TonB